MTSPPARSPHRAGWTLAAALWLLGGCGRSTPADTPPVVLASGQVGGQTWRLEGRRAGGRPCTSLFLEGAADPTIARCGVHRTPLRHVDPVVSPVGGRLVVFSPLPASVRRVRLDGADGSIRVEAAQSAPGFPARFFVVDLDPGNPPVDVRAFSEGGRAVVT